MIKRYIAKKEESLKDFLLSSTDISKNILASIASGKGQYIVNDMNVNTTYILHPNDNIEIVLPESMEGDTIKSVLGDINILYEDSYLLILNKQNNVACIPTKQHFESSLANYVLCYYKRKGILSNIHFVNRLDAATSGIIILAKNPYICDIMSKSILKKKYLLEVNGYLDNKEGIIKTGIRRINSESIKREVYFEKINSKTEYKVLDEYNNISLIEATLHTGKTHQLRLHFNYLNHSIIGDYLYGEKTNDDILHLHSYYLEFIHPISKEIITINSYPNWLNKEELDKIKK